MLIVSSGTFNFILSFLQFSHLHIVPCATRMLVAFSCFSCNFLDVFTITWTDFSLFFLHTTYNGFLNSTFTIRWAFFILQYLPMKQAYSSSVCYHSWISVFISDRERFEETNLKLIREYIKNLLEYYTIGCFCSGVADWKCSKKQEIKLKYLFWNFNFYSWKIKIFFYRFREEIFSGNLSFRYVIFQEVL